MNRILVNLFVVSFAIALAASASAGTLAEIKLRDGSKWRGQVSDLVELRFMQQGVEVPLEGKLLKVDNLYIQVEATVAGKTAPKTIFKSDIVWMKSKQEGSSDVQPSAATLEPVKSSEGVETTPAQASTETTETKDDQLGVFVLPMAGFVGGPFRHEEIDLMAKEADKFGPGQVIILLIDSNGGSSFESQKIAESIFEIKKRHRVIGWIHKAISAGCQTAMCCDEIYFMTEGTAGSVTTWNPGTGQSIKGQELLDAMEDLARIAERAGRSKYIAYAMKTNPALLSYDKDPVTGEVTWYDTLEGEFDLSGADDNLCFNASNAEHSGFSDGTADTEEQLAKLLNLPKWHELSDYGRRIAKQWQRTHEEAESEIPLLMQRLSYKNTSTGDPIVILGTRISILNDLLHWWDRLGPNTGQMLLPDRNRLEREIVELRKDVADIKKAQRGR